MNLSKILPVITVFCFIAPAYASRVFVEPATGTNVTDGDLGVATQLIRNSVPEVSRNEVVSSPDQADFSLRPNLMRLGAAYELGLAKVDKDGTISFSSQLKAQQMDELDKVATRLTRSVLTGIRATDDQHVGEITHEEAREGTERRPARKEWYLGFGGAEFSNLNASGLGYSLGAAYAWDVNTALIKLMAEFAELDSAFVASVGLGGNYFLTTGDVAPYLAADFGFGGAKAQGGGGFFSGQTLGGFDVGVGGGIQFLRTSSVNLDIGFRAGFLLHSTTAGTPEVYSLRLGVYF